VNLIWATRGRTWGFRFLLNGGFPDPLATYEVAFAGTEGVSSLCARVGPNVALRFPDPLGRRDDAGRIIPHDIVVLPPLDEEVRTVDDGVLRIWPRLAHAFELAWDAPKPPSPGDVRASLA